MVGREKKKAVATRNFPAVNFYCKDGKVVGVKIYFPANTHT